MEKKNKVLKNQKLKQGGITLIALVITVIVLLILAGVTIATLTGDSGILSNAEKAKEKTERANKIELEQISDMEGRLNDYVDHYDESKGCNIPKLTTGMEPVNYNSSKGKWEKCTIEEWDWDYIDQEENTTDGTTGNIGTSKWANAMSEDGSLWVWIPRYAYSIKSNYHSNTAGEIDIVFLVGTTNKDGEGNKYATTYDISAATEAGKMTSYVVHPVFTRNTTQGGWDAETTGFWVSKFEAGYAGTPGEPETAKDSTVKYTANLTYDGSGVFDNIYGVIEPEKTLMKYPTFTPGVFSYNCVSVGDAYELAKNLNAEENPYGFSKNCNTHLIKNSEWGAVAYLAQSKYGRNGTEISINNWGPSGDLSSTGQSYYTVDHNNTFFTAHTGYSSGVSPTDTSGRNNGDKSTTNYYNTEKGGLASTTGNVYGVFDLSGGVAEYVSDYADSLNASKTTVITGTENGFYSYYGKYLIADKTEKLRTILTTTGDAQTSAMQRENYATHANVFGDAIWETSNDGSSSSGSWNADYSAYLCYDSAFLYRGGSYGNGAGAGAFYFSLVRGSLTNNLGFRACVVSPD